MASLQELQMQTRHQIRLKHRDWRIFNAFDASYSILHDLQLIVMSKNIAVSIVTDSDSLLKVITKSSNMKDKRLIIDVQAGREQYHDRKIDYMRWVKSANSFTGGLTKINKSELI